MSKFEVVGKASVEGEETEWVAGIFESETGATKFCQEVADWFDWAVKHCTYDAWGTVTTNFDGVQSRMEGHDKNFPVVDGSYVEYTVRVVATKVTRNECPSCVRDGKWAGFVDCEAKDSDTDVEVTHNECQHCKDQGYWTGLDYGE